MKKIFLKSIYSITIFSLVFSMFSNYWQINKAHAAGNYSILDGSSLVSDLPSSEHLLAEFFQSGYNSYLITDYSGNDGLITGLKESAKNLVRAGYAGRQDINIENGKDRLTIEDYTKLGDYLKDNPAEQLKYRQNPEYLPEQFAKLPRIDEKLLASLIQVADPQSIGGYNNKPVTLGRINKGHTTSEDNRNLSDENQAANLTDGESENNNSHHNLLLAQADDWTQKGQIKCTYVKCDDQVGEGHPGNGDGDCDNNEIRNPKTDIKPYKVYDIDFSKINPKDQDLNDLISDPQKMLNAKTINDLTGNLSAINLFNTMGKSFDITDRDMLAMFQNYQLDFRGGIANLALPFANYEFGKQLGLNWNLDLTKPLIGKDFSSTINNFASGVLSNIFNGQITNFSGNTLKDWTSNIGQSNYEKLLNLPNGSLSGDVQVTAGKRDLEKVLGLASGTLDTSIADQNSLLTTIGRGLMANNLHLDIGDLNTNSLDELKNKISPEKFDEVFYGDMRLVDSLLGVPFGTAKSNISNPNNLAKIVGEKIKSDISDLYQNYQVKDNDSQDLSDENNKVILNSRDEAILGFTNYLKPKAEVDIDNKMIISTPTQNPQTGEITWSKDMDVDVADKSVSKLNTIENYYQTYEKLLYKKQKDNVLIDQFFNGQNLDGVYQKVGQGAIANSLSSNEEDSYYLKWFLNSGRIPQKTISYQKDDQTITTTVDAIDLKKLAKSTGLNDWYDIKRIFIDNRGDEIFPYYGQQILGGAFGYNPEVVSNETNTSEYLENKLSQLSNVINEFSDGNAKEDLLIYLKDAQNAKSESIETTIINPKEKQISRYLNKMGEVIKINNLENSSTAQEIFNLIYEIGAQKDIFTMDSADFSQLKPNLGLGIKTDDLKKMFANPDSLNLSNIASDIGSRVLNYSLDLDESFSTTFNKVQDVLTNFKGNDFSSVIMDKFGSDSFNQLARALNASFPLDVQKTITSQEVAKIFNGGQFTLLARFANQPITQSLGLTNGTFLDVIKGLGTNNANIMQNINKNLFGIFSSGGINDLKTDFMSEIINNLSSPDFVKNFTKSGFEFLPNIISSFSSLSGQALTDSFKGLSGNLQNFFLAGNQTLSSILSIQKMGGTIGEFVSKSLTHLPDLNKIFKEINAQKMFDFITGEFPDVLGKMGDLLDKIRIDLSLKDIDFSDINKWIGDSFGSLGNDLNGLLKGLNGLGELKVLEKISTIVKSLDIGAMAHKYLDAYIPSDLVSSMLTGDMNAMSSATKTWVFNKITASINSLPASSKGIASGLLDVFSGKASPDSLKPAAINFFISQYGKSFDISGLPAGSGKELLNGLANNNWSGLEKMGMDKLSITKMQSSGMDELLSMEEGTTFDLNQSFSDAEKEFADMEKSIGELNFDKFFDANSLLDMAKSSIEGILTGMVTSQLNQIEKAMGLPKGTLQKLITAFVNPAALPLGLLGAALGSGILGSITGSLGGLFGDGGGEIEEIDCAMDYFPRLEPKFNYNGIDYAYSKPTVSENSANEAEAEQASMEGADSGDNSAEENPNIILDEDGNVIEGNRIFNTEDETNSPSTDKSCLSFSDKPNNLSQDIELTIGQCLENLGSPYYEFKGSPGEIESLVQSKLPLAVYMKGGQLVWEYLDLVNSLSQYSQILPAQVMVPEWKKTPVGENIGERILDKFMYKLDYYYGEREQDSATGELTDKIKTTMKEMMQNGKIISGFFTQPMVDWFHLSW